MKGLTVVCTFVFAMNIMTDFVLKYTKIRLYSAKTVASPPPPPPPPPPPTSLSLSLRFLTAVDLQSAQAQKAFAGLSLTRKTRQQGHHPDIRLDSGQTGTLPKPEITQSGFRVVTSQPLCIAGEGVGVGGGGGEGGAGSH